MHDADHVGCLQDMSLLAAAVRLVQGQQVLADTILNA